MVWWKQFVLSVVGCVMISGIITQILSDCRYKKVVRMICGAILAVTVLGEVSVVDTRNLEINLEQFSPEPFVTIGEQTAERERIECIRQACESYISSKAEALGMKVSAIIHLSDEMIPDSVQLYVESDSQYQSVLAGVLEDELGITKENQLWIWNQEKNSY